MAAWAGTLVLRDTCAVVLCLYLVASLRPRGELFFCGVRRREPSHELRPSFFVAAHFITRAFKQCCADGQLGEYALKQIRAVPKLYESLLQAYIGDDGEVSYEDLPSSWTCNVKERVSRTNNNSARRRNVRRRRKNNNSTRRRNVRRP